MEAIGFTEEEALDTPVASPVETRLIDGLVKRRRQYAIPDSRTHDVLEARDSLEERGRIILHKPTINEPQILDDLGRTF
jgi:hypothetical protein